MGGRKEFDSLMLKLDKTETSSEFVEACNALSLYLIGKGETPEELNIKRTIGRVKEKYTEFNDPCADRLCTGHVGQKGGGCVRLVHRSAAQDSAQAGEHWLRLEWRDAGLLRAVLSLLCLRLYLLAAGVSGGI